MGSPHSNLSNSDSVGDVHVFISYTLKNKYISILATQWRHRTSQQPSRDDEPIAHNAVQCQPSPIREPPPPPQASPQILFCQHQRLLSHISVEQMRTLVLLTSDCKGLAVLPLTKGGGQLVNTVEYQCEALRGGFILLLFFSLENYVQLLKGLKEVTHCITHIEL